jgi:hypothetical protein
MKSIRKVLPACAVVAFAVAIAAGPSEAAKKKKAMPAACSPFASCATDCKGNSCELRSCGADGKWYLPVLSRVCRIPDCPTKC